MAVNKSWFLVCVLWALVGASCLYAIDGSLIEGVVWLVAGVLIGCFGGFFLARFDELLSDRDKPFASHVLMASPEVGLIIGILAGPLLGAGAAAGFPGDGWRGALLGAVLGPPLVALALLVSSSPACRLTGRLKWYLRAKDWGKKSKLRVRRSWLALLVCAALPLVVLLVLVRCFTWIPRHRQRLKAFAKLQDVGAVFVADAARDLFYGATAKGPGFMDEHACLLRLFSELDQVSLPGTAVTDTGVACLRRFWNLQVVSLADTTLTQPWPIWRSRKN
jgi:hypothetical protein